MQATWHQAASGVAWTQGGANGSGDRKSTRRSVVRVNAAPGQTVAIDLTTLAQEWVSIPAGNLCLLLRPTLLMNNATMTYRFASANHSDPAWRPRLVVTYTGGQAYNPSQPPGHASLAQQPAPEATPPANHTGRSYYHAAGRRVATPARAVQMHGCGCRTARPARIRSTTSSPIIWAARTSRTTLRPTARRRDASAQPPVAQRSGPSMGHSAAWTQQRAADGLHLHRSTGQRTGVDVFSRTSLRPRLGRFTQPDSIVPDPGDPQALNRYSYVGNRPTVAVDPSGHSACIDFLCDLVAHPTTNRPVLHGRLPAAVKYIFGEMVRNVQSVNAGRIALGNERAEEGGLIGAVYKLGAHGIWGSQVMDAGVRNMVPDTVGSRLARWDHKPILRDTSGPVPEIMGQYPEGYSTIGSQLYRFDTWSNVHFGYVGTASGFSSTELTGGAGIEQIGSDLYRAIKVVLSTGDLANGLQLLPRQSGHANNWGASWDDPADTTAIQMGIGLWVDYGMSATAADLYLGILENPGLPTW